MHYSLFLHTVLLLFKASVIFLQLWVKDAFVHFYSISFYELLVLMLAFYNLSSHLIDDVRPSESNGCLFLYLIVSFLLRNKQHDGDAL